MSFLSKKLKGMEGVDSEGGGVFCYVNSVFAPGLDEGVGGLWRVSCALSFTFFGWGNGEGDRLKSLGRMRRFGGGGLGFGLTLWLAVLQDGRSAYCGIFDDACFWMRSAMGMRVFDRLRMASRGGIDAIQRELGTTQVTALRRNP